jgi:phosphoenolpyruvate synthase/pyruvate phosphate dikinase
MQTDDIFILADQSFVVIEEEALFIVKIMIKSREKLISNNALKFNDTRIERLESNEIEIIYFRQETHIQGIQLIKVEFTIITGVRDKIRAMLILRNQYIAQRAREAYLA